jgi:hypothetical protein
MLRGVRLEPLVSCKVVIREDRTEGSRTTKLGSDLSAALRVNPAETGYEA